MTTTTKPEQSLHARPSRMPIALTAHPITVSFHDDTYPYYLVTFGAVTVRGSVKWPKVTIGTVVQTYSPSEVDAEILQDMTPETFLSRFQGVITANGSLRGNDLWVRQTDVDTIDFVARTLRSYRDYLPAPPRGFVGWFHQK